MDFQGLEKGFSGIVKEPVHVLQGEFCLPLLVALHGDPDSPRGVRSLIPGRRGLPSPLCLAVRASLRSWSPAGGASSRSPNAWPYKVQSMSFTHSVV